MSEIFQRIFNLHEGGVVQRGFVLGRDIPDYPWPYDRSASFNDLTVNLCDDLMGHITVGMTEDEIYLLGTTLFGSESPFLRQVREKAGMSGPELEAPTRTGMSYCTRDVMALARALSEPSSRVVTSPTNIAYVKFGDYPRGPPLPDWCYSSVVEDIDEEEFMRRMEEEEQFAMCPALRSPRQSQQ